MELKKKTFVLIIVFLGILFLAFTWKLVYKHMYINSYKDIVLEEESHWYVDDLNVEVPYWVAVYDMEETEKKEKKYGILLPNIDFNDEMFVVSYGAKLTKLDYSTMDLTYMERGEYIGFPEFSVKEKNVIYLYRAKKVPLVDKEKLGYPPEYRGKYRE